MKAVITAERGEFVVRTPYSDNIKKQLKAVDGRRWDGAMRAWVYPATSASAATLSDVMEYLDLEVEGDAVFKRRLRQWDAGAKVLAGEYDPMPPCRTDPFDHQNLGYRLIEARDGTYLAWDMGVGKSKSVVDAVTLLGLRRVLIAGPVNVLPVWPGQFADHGDGSVRVVVLDCKKSVTKRAELLVDIYDNEVRPVVFVVNYQAVWLPPLGPTLKKTDAKGRKIKKRIITDTGTLLSRKWDMVVTDEAHWIKGEKSSVSWFFSLLGKRADRRVALSGTPAGNSPLDLWAQLRFVDPGLFGTSFATFRARYAVLGGFQGKQTLGFRNLEVLNKKFYMVAHRVERHKVLNLPPVMHEKIEVELCPEARVLYDDLAASFVTGIGDGTITTSNVLTELLRLQQLTGGAVGTDQGDLVVVDHAKEGAVKELLSNMPPDEKSVVFGRFVHDVEATCALVGELGRTPRKLRGGCNERDEWVADESGSVLAVQIDSGGEGIDLTSARYCIYWSVGFSLLRYEQSLARIDRHGQTRPGMYYHIIAKNTVDVKVYAALRAKKRVADIILDEVKAGGIEALHGERMGAS